MLYFVIVLAACSLLNIELKSDATPLSPEQQRLRTATRDFGEIFFTAIEKTAQSIQNNTTDTKYKENAITWKINAQAIAIDAIYKNQPAIAFVDMWAFTIQMHNFFATEKGKELFGPYVQEVLKTSSAMENAVATLAQQYFSKKDAQDIRTFLDSYVQKHPITDLTFQRYPVYTLWAANVAKKNREIQEANKGKKKNEKQEKIGTTVGTMPEVLSDMSDRIAVLTRQVQKNLVWQTELLALNGDVDVKLLGKTVDNMYESSIELKDILLNKDDTLNTFASVLTDKMYPVITTLDTTGNKYMVRLESLSTNVATMLETQRLAIEALVANERATILATLDTMRESTIKQVMQELSAMISSVLWVLIVFLLVVLFIPFSFGMFIGRLTKKRNS